MGGGARGGDRLGGVRGLVSGSADRLELGERHRPGNGHAAPLAAGKWALSRHRSAEPERDGGSGTLAGAGNFGGSGGTEVEILGPAEPQRLAGGRSHAAGRVYADRAGRRGGFTAARRAGAGGMERDRSRRRTGERGGRIFRERASSRVLGGAPAAVAGRLGAGRGGPTPAGGRSAAGDRRVPNAIGRSRARLGRWQRGGRVGTGVHPRGLAGIPSGGSSSDAGAGPLVHRLERVARGTHPGNSGRPAHSS